MSSPRDYRKQQVYFDTSDVVDIRSEAARLDRTLSWVMQRVWKIARAEIRRIPSANPVDEFDDVPTLEAPTYVGDAE